MKKLLFVAGISIFILLLASFVNFKVPASTGVANINTIKKDVIECYPGSFDANAKLFAGSGYTPFAMMVRKNVYSLSAAEITSLKTGIAAMKALPLADPTSWEYQAAIHGTLMSNNLPQWNTCQHGTQFFFSWHRMYLYFFERILRAKSGDPNLTLPYWDYQTNAALHPDYRNSAAGNTLYDGSRNGSINGGGSLGSGPMTAINNSLDNISYWDFQTDIEDPHGSIHVAIGGNMGHTYSAGKDPVFWLHHANIDRLWEEWQRKCGGRSNPTSSDATWWNKTYTFFDETGTAVNMTGNQIVNTASALLNYKYDFPAKLPCNFKIDWAKWKYRYYKIIKWPDPGPLRINEKFMKRSMAKADPAPLRSFIQAEKTDKFHFSTTDISDKLLIEIEGLKMNKAIEGVVEVYINLKPGETPTPQSRSFVGVLDLFTAEAMAHHGEKKIKNLNASAAARKLGLTVSDLQKAEVTFFVRGNTIRGQEVSTVADISIDRVNLAVQRAAR